MFFFFFFVRVPHGSREMGQHAPPWAWGGSACLWIRPLPERNAEVQTAHRGRVRVLSHDASEKYENVLTEEQQEQKKTSRV